MKKGKCLGNPEENTYQSTNKEGKNIITIKNDRDTDWKRPVLKIISAFQK